MDFGKQSERQRCHREQVLIELTAELNLLHERQDDHPKAACTLLTSRRYGRYPARIIPVAPGSTPPRSRRRRSSTASSSSSPLLSG
jgi:hypothetical protein